MGSCGLTAQKDGPEELVSIGPWWWIQLLYRLLNIAIGEGRGTLPSIDLIDILHKRMCKRVMFLLKS